jgi:hypothetical protein
MSLGRLSAPHRTDQHRSADLSLKSAVRDDVRWWKRKAKAAERKPATANEMWSEELLTKALEL